MQSKGYLPWVENFRSVDVSSGTMGRAACVAVNSTLNEQRSLTQDTTTLWWSCKRSKAKVWPDTIHDVHIGEDPACRYAVQRVEGGGGGNKKTQNICNDQTPS